MNTTMDQDSLGTPPPGDLGGDDTVDNKDKDKDNPGGELPDDPGGGTPPVGSPSAPPLDDPGGGDTMTDKDKDNPHTNDDPPLDSPGSRDFNTPHQLASSNTKASRFSLISVTMAPLNKPTGEVMNTTMDKDSLASNGRSWRR